MPYVQIDMIEGRTTEQKREMAKKITKVISETAKCPEEAIHIIIREAKKEHIAKGGILVADK
ncbi:MAG: 2-hydroxymuconate tautomerase family protein [Pelosinus sp.]|nr:2-hydroxymuconate tautomerase family protein [Pelosinus sp.]